MKPDCGDGPRRGWRRIGTVCSTSPSTDATDPQRPLFRAYQQDPQAVERWKTQEYPAIHAEAKKVGASIYFADEASVRSDYHAGTCGCRTVIHGRDLRCCGMVAVVSHQE